MNNLYIVITDFNGYDQTRRCLKALRASHNREFSVLVVDHGTSNETRDKLGAEFPEIIRLVGSPTLWWSGATNLGIRFALECGADAIMLLNNDCYVMPDTISILAELEHKHPKTIIAPLQREWKSKQLMPITFDSNFLLGFPSISVSLKLTDSIHNLMPVKLIGGGRGVIIPASVFTQLGLFDEGRLPHYGADHDFYLRARKKKIPLYIVPRAYVEIDNTRTTLADKSGMLSFAEFLDSLCSMRSHRNIHDVTNLFKLHYPIPYLYPLGVALYIGRYFLIYLINRGTFMLRRANGDEEL